MEPDTLNAFMSFAIPITDRSLPTWHEPSVEIPPIVVKESETDAHPRIPASSPTIIPAEIPRDPATDTELPVRPIAAFPATEKLLPSRTNEATDRELAAAKPRDTETFPEYVAKFRTVTDAIYAVPCTLKSEPKYAPDDVEVS
jgi:hypothetical protein